MHDLMQGNKNSISLGKPTDDLITPNEYTFYLLHLILFYVDILDSQISASNVYTGRCHHENFHMIHIMSLRNSIW